MDGPTDWNRFYPSSTADSTVVSTGPVPAQPVHNIEGRVGKASARRRTRASRRAPTTLLNTDPTNFRAMVQQFTGAPAGPYASPAGPVLSFGYADRIHQPQATPVNLGQFGQYRGQQQFDGAVPLPGGNNNDSTGEGFGQGFNSTAAGGFFLEGMMGGSNRNNGYFL